MNFNTSSSFSACRVKLNKRRAKGGAGGITSAVSKLIVRNREPTEAELQLQVCVPVLLLFLATGNSGSW